MSPSSLNKHPYYFRFTFIFRLFKGKEVITRLVRHGFHGQDISETMATSVLVSLEKGDIVELKCYGVYSDMRRHITFAGVSMHPRAAFAVARTFQSTDDFSTNLSNPDDADAVTSYLAVQFDIINVNIGRHFDISKGVFTCAVPGLYHVTFSVGKRRHDHVHILLMHNKEPVAGIYQLTSYTYPGNNTIESTTSRSVVLDMQFNDKLYLQAVPGTSFYSSRDCEMTFSAALLNKCYYCPKTVGVTRESTEATTPGSFYDSWQLWR